MAKNNKEINQFVEDLSKLDVFLHEAIDFMIKQFKILKSGMDNKDFGEIKEAQLKTLLDIIDRGMGIRQKMHSMATENEDSVTVRGGYKLNDFSIPKRKKDG